MRAASALIRSSHRIHFSNEMTGLFYQFLLRSGEHHASGTGSNAEKGSAQDCLIPSPQFNNTGPCCHLTNLIGSITHNIISVVI